MIVKTPAGEIVLADSINDLSAQRYLLFNQAWVRAMGEGGDFYGTESHLARIGLFLNKKNVDAARSEYTNLVLHLRNLSGSMPEHLIAQALAPLVVSIAGIAFTTITEAGLKATANAILATGITEGNLQKAVEDSKKNFQPNSN